MICLRCGHCCINYMTSIVNDPLKGITNNNIILNNKPCKHLSGNKPGKYKCLIYDYEWYKKTPCFEFTQIEKSSDIPCRIGYYIINGYSHNKRLQKK